MIVRRTLAQEFCDAGLIKINGARAKSSREVKTDDEVEIKRHNRLTTLKVLQIPDKKQLARSDAANLYQIISEEILESEF